MPFDPRKTDNRLPHQMGRVDSADPSAAIAPMHPAGFAYPSFGAMSRRRGMVFGLVPSPSVIRSLAAGGVTEFVMQGTSTKWYELTELVFQTFTASGQANAGEPLNTYLISIRTQSPSSRLTPVPNWTMISNVASQGKGRTNERLWPLPWVLAQNNDLRIQIRNDSNVPMDIVLYSRTRQHLAAKGQ